jgi:hypothetical protein
VNKSQQDEQEPSLFLLQFPQVKTGMKKFFKKTGMNYTRHAAQGKYNSHSKHQVVQ